MQPNQNRYWPFKVLPAEKQTDQHRREIQFLEAAHKLGYQPYVFGSENFGATSEMRAGEMIYRGKKGKHWELLLVQAGKLVLAAHIDDFGCAAEGLLRWLCGVDGREILEYVREHLLITPGTAPGFAFHAE